jgi:hypothetical protein
MTRVRSIRQQVIGADQHEHPMVRKMIIDVGSFADGFPDPIQSGSRPQKCSTALAIDKSGALAYPRLAPHRVFSFPVALICVASSERQPRRAKD